MSNIRARANKAKNFRCKNLIAVLESPKTIENIASAIRNVDALGAEKLYVVDDKKLLPSDWHQMRERHSLNKISASAVKWTYVKVFRTTQACIDHLAKKNFTSMVTSPHVKGKNNITLDGGIFTQPRLAIWFGNESHGISDVAVNNSAYCVSIPMCGIIESLNLGTSTGIVLYEITKQRRKFQDAKKARKICKTS
jgi:tRNA (guanosine-2'-O-)-methyltransferase